MLSLLSCPIHTQMRDIVSERRAIKKKWPARYPAALASDAFTQKKINKEEERLQAHVNTRVGDGADHANAERRAQLRIEGETEA